MTTPRKPNADAVARQTVGFLVGALIGFGVAARLVMNDPDAAGQNAWAGALLIILGCGIAGVIVASVAAALQANNQPPPVPPEVEATAQQHFHPSPGAPPVDPRPETGGLQPPVDPNRVERHTPPGS